MSNVTLLHYATTNFIFPQTTLAMKTINLICTSAILGHAVLVCSLRSRSTFPLFVCGAIGFCFDIYYVSVIEVLLFLRKCMGGDFTTAIKLAGGLPIQEPVDQHPHRPDWTLSESIQFVEKIKGRPG